MFERLDDTSEVDCRSFVMTQIEEGSARMRSRWFVMTQYLGWRTTWIVLVLALIGILNLNLFIISRSPEWQFVDFGASGFWLVAQYLPYGWWALAFTLMTIAIIGMKRFSFTYTWPFHIFAAFTVFGLFFIGTLAFASGINDHLYRKLVEEPGASHSLLARIYCFGANRGMTAQNALVGEVMEVTRNSLVVQTPNLDVVTVFAREGAVLPGPGQVQKFQVVKMLGTRNHDLFLASNIKVDEMDALHLSRDEEDCVDKQRWIQKQEVVQRRRDAVQQPFTPVYGTAQLIKNIY